MFILSSIIPDENSSNVKEPVAKEFFSSISTSDDRSIFNFYITRINSESLAVQSSTPTLANHNITKDNKNCEDGVSCMLSFCVYIGHNVFWRLGVIPLSFLNFLGISFTPKRCCSSQFSETMDLREWVNLEIDFVTYEVRRCPRKFTVWSSETHKGLRRTNLEAYSRTLNHLRSSKLHFQTQSVNLFRPFPGCFWGALTTPSQFSHMLKRSAADHMLSFSRNSNHSNHVPCFYRLLANMQDQMSVHSKPILGQFVF